MKGGSLMLTDSQYHITRKKRKGSHSAWENMVADILDYFRIPYARQVWIEGFRVDFVLVGLDTIIEVDDLSHSSYTNLVDDRRQDELTALVGFSTLRIRTQDIDNKYHEVVKTIDLAIRRAERRFGRPKF